MEKVLSAIDLIIDKVHGHRADPNPLMRVAIMESYTLDTRKKDNPQDYCYEDYKLKWNKGFQNIADYVRVEFQRKRDIHRNFVLTDYWGNVFFPQQQSLNKNTVMVNDLKHSPDHTCVYCVRVEEGSCNMVFEYDDNRRVGSTWSIPLETSKYIIIPSHLRYFISRNNGRKENMFFTMVAENA